MVQVKLHLLSLILGLLKPTKGNIFIDNKLVRKNISLDIGYINQGAIHTSLPITVDEVINIGRVTKYKMDIDEVIELLKINHLRNKIFRELSGW